MVLAVTLVTTCSSPGSDLPVLPVTSAISSYRLGPGDQLDINVLGADELKGRYSVQDDGTISMLLIGKIPAEGRTVDDLEREISTRLKKGAYVTKPETTISVRSISWARLQGRVVIPTPAECVC
jgi:polysaccharide biosynthesis/export protein